jgi:hypothetical protein
MKWRVRFRNGEIGIVEDADDRADAIREAEVRFLNGTPISAEPILVDTEDDVFPERAAK